MNRAVKSVHITVELVHLSLCKLTITKTAKLIKTMSLKLFNFSLIESIELRQQSWQKFNFELIKVTN